MTNLSSVLACPRCRTAMNDLTCKSCRVTFPEHGGIPWLFADAGAAVSDWRNRWQLALGHMQADLNRVETALQSAPSDPTERRLRALAAGYRAQRGHLQDLLEPLARAPGTAQETLLALRTRLPPSQGIFRYEANVHRDWNWGGEECAAAVGAILAQLGDHAPRRVLVLGAGAGRLAYDVHQRTAAALTIALDLNPLLAYAGLRASAGETVPLVEFPLAPKTPESAAVQRTLQAPAPSRTGLRFVLADALRAPFQPASFDLVITPWLLDVMDEPAATVIAHVNPLLTDDGLWINQGSVAFDHPDPAQRLTLEELMEAARSGGFEPFAPHEQTVPYMNCPDSRHGRMECVVTLACRKRQTLPLPDAHAGLPDWIVEGRVPIPALPAFRTQAMTTRMHAFIMTLIDGQRSLKDIATLMEEQQLMTRQEAEAALRGFLIRMYEEARGAGRPPT